MHLIDPLHLQLPLKLFFRRQTHPSVLIIVLSGIVIDNMVHKVSFSTVVLLYFPPLGSKAIDIRQLPLSHLLLVEILCKTTVILSTRNL